MDQETKTCALVAASDFNAAHFSSCNEQGIFSSVVAVDGGFSHLDSIGVKPCFVVGDFDSLGYVPEGDNVEVHPTHKDESDLELGLDLVLREGFQRVFVYGALGGRLDHTIAALQICARYAEGGLEMTLVGVDAEVRIVVGPGECRIPAQPQGTVSVFAASDEALDVAEWGMEYSLEHARLTNRMTLGLSNELKGLPAGVSVGQGSLYVFCPIADER